MISRRRTTVRRGSWRWAARVAEAAAWGTAALVFLVITVAEVPLDVYRRGVLLVVGLCGWLLFFFRFLLARKGPTPVVAWLGITVDLAFATGVFALLRGHVASAQFVYVPLIMATGLLGNLRQTLAATGLAIASYFGVALLDTTGPSVIGSAITVGIFLLSGSIAGLLARELRQHYRGELAEHRTATTTRHRLEAVLDSIDEAIVYRDLLGVTRLINSRSGALFELDPEAFTGMPAVEFLRAVARRTEDPEEFMEEFQSLRGDPMRELRLDVDQIIPVRRNLKVFSGPTFDDKGELTGRIDVYTDVTDSVQAAREVARLYEEARRTAESYQRSLLPDSPPSVPRVSIVAHYVPAAGRRAVCGDFYDFVPLQDGRVGVVLGDVCGIGPKAANDAALTRYTLRSLSMEESDPARLMEQMNRQVFRQSKNERFVRLLLAVLDPERAVLRYANAGHVPPVLYRARDGAVDWLGEGGLVLGVESESGYKAGEIDLDPGDILVFYTDGLTEAPRNGRPFGQGKFTDIVKDYGMGTPGELVQALRRAVEAWAPELRDDLAIVICQVAPDRTLGEPARELVLPNEPSRVPEVRAFVASFLADVRAPVEISSEILLAVGEAAANATRHGRSPEGRSEMRVYCAIEGPSVSVTIADDGPGFDPEKVAAAELPDRFSSGGRGLYLMRALMDEVEVEPGERGTKVTMFRKIFGTSGG